MIGAKRIKMVGGLFIQGAVLLVEGARSLVEGDRSLLEGARYVWSVLGGLL
jgi:hypothetical protein